MKTLTPLGPRVVVRRKAVATVSAGGIHLAPEASEKPDEGEVIAVGCGYRKEDGSVVPLDVKVGDLVLFNKYSGSDIDLDPDTDDDYLVMEESNIFGILS